MDIQFGSEIGERKRGVYVFLRIFVEERPQRKGIRYILVVLIVGMKEDKEFLVVNMEKGQDLHLEV